ncbi:MAG: triose-phosphate isomerase [Anaerolineales bacterium]|nr:triose-phosphate isomerase [Anaerolineales bacterium]
MRRKFVAGNWKMNKTISEARQLITELLLTLKSLDGIDRAVCPPSMALPMAARLLEGTGVGLGAQNMYWEESGAYTGELAPNMVAELCGYVLIGHSERRGYFGETDETVNLKVKAALAHGLTPIVCMGESLEENQAGKTAEVISRQVRGGLAGLTPEEGAKLVIAYEPIWAIGTGLAATAEDANAIHCDVVRPALAEIFGEQVAQGIQIQYGGSVKPDNADGFFAQSDIDGALVGGASLKAESFAAIARAAADAS